MAKAPKTTGNDDSVNAFLDKAVPEPQRRADCDAILAMMQKAAGVAPKMWGSAIIGFGTYVYKYESGKTGEWPVVGFSPRKNDLTVYIMPGYEKAQPLLAKLGKHKTGKSCLYIKKLADVDAKVLQKIIEFGVEGMKSKRVS
jgi:hypothetical protein